jgi:hypothetical protein
MQRPAVPERRRRPARSGGRRRLRVVGHVPRPPAVASWHRSYHRTMTQSRHAGERRRELRRRHGRRDAGRADAPRQRGRELWAEFDDPGCRGQTGVRWEQIRLPRGQIGDRPGDGPGSVPVRPSQRRWDDHRSHNQQIYCTRPATAVLGQLPAIFLPPIDGGFRAARRDASPGGRGLAIRLNAASLTASARHAVRSQARAQNARRRVRSRESWHGPATRTRAPIAIRPPLRLAPDRPVRPTIVQPVA